MKMKIATLAIAGCLMAPAAFAQATASALSPSVSPLTPVVEDFFGNTVVVGTKACSAVQGTFPIKTTLYALGSSSTYYLQILIENPALPLPLQYLTAIIGPSTGYDVFDPNLFETTSLIAGTYTGAITISGNLLSLGTTAAPIVLTQTVASGVTPCVLSLTGTLLYSP